jgi:hypothetical protein
MEEDPIAMIGLGILLVITLVAGSGIAIRNAKLLRKVKIQEEDGTLQPPTRDEVFAISQHLASNKGKHFWHLIVVGIILVGLATLFVRLALVPYLDL